jgi:hypothetical protein
VTAAGNAQVSTAQSKFGGASALFDGTGDYLNSATGFSFAGDFTVEFFVRFASIGANSRGLASDRPPTSAGYTTSNWYIEKNTNNGLFAGINGFGDIITSDSLVTTNTWYHIAFVRSGTTVSLYLDGTSRGTPLTCGTSVGDGDISFGAIVGLYLDGHMDEIRVSNSARYTANFTPTTTAFTNDANTLLLLHCNGDNTSTIFVDDASTDATQKINSTGLYFSNNYWGNDIAYLGNDSSNRPVFAYAYSAVTTYYPTLFIFRLNTSDLTITNGSTYTLDTTFQCYYASVASERDGSGLRTSSGFTDYAYVTWGRINGSPTDLRVAAFSYDLNNLTATLGTAITGIAAANIYPVGNAGGGYIGNRQFAVASQGGNNGNHIVQNWVTRSSGSTTLTKNGGTDSSTLGNAGQGGIHNVKGFSTGRWLMGYGTGNNGHSWCLSVVRQNSTAMVGANWIYNVSGQTPVYNTVCQYAQLNNSTRFISVCYGQFNTTVYHRATAYTVTWNTGATAPTITAGTTVDIGSASPSNGLAYSLAEGKADGEAYFLHRTSSGFQYRKLTVSTNTITVGSANSISSVSPPTTIYAVDANRIIQIGGDYYWITMYRNQDTGELQTLVIKNPV